MKATARELKRRADRLHQLATVGDRLAQVANLPAYVSRELSEERRRLFYELAYLRLCYTWEWFLEDTFLQCLTRNPSISPGGALNQPPFKNLAAAKESVFAGIDYISWANYRTTSRLLDGYVKEGIHKRVLASYVGRLSQYFAIRHHIAHDSTASRSAFDDVTRQLSSKIFPEGCGEFLRSRDKNSSNPQRWFETIAEDFCALAAQVDPS